MLYLNRDGRFASLRKEVTERSRIIVRLRELLPQNEINSRLPSPTPPLPQPPPFYYYINPSPLPTNSLSKPTIIWRIQTLRVLRHSRIQQPSHLEQKFNISLQSQIHSFTAPPLNHPLPLLTGTSPKNLHLHPPFKLEREIDNKT